MPGLHRSIRATLIGAGCGVALLLSSPTATSHPGRRFEIQIVEGRLVAQGVNTAEELPHGEQPVRPYANVVHDHFTNYVMNGAGVSTNNLPGFDIPSGSVRLLGYRVAVIVEAVYEIPYPLPEVARLTDARRPLTASRELTVELAHEHIASRELPGTLTISAAVPREGVVDVDPFYLLSASAAESFVVMVMRLTTTAPGVEASLPICAVLAPPGHQFHGVALAIEERLAVEGC